MCSTICIFVFHRLLSLHSDPAACLHGYTLDTFLTYLQMVYTFHRSHAHALGSRVSLNSIINYVVLLILLPHGTSASLGLSINALSHSHSVGSPPHLFPLEPLSPIFPSVYPSSILNSSHLLLFPPPPPPKSFPDALTTGWQFHTAQKLIHDYFTVP